MIKGDIRRAFTYLESGAVLLVTTNDGTSDNVMTISWQMVIDFSPHIAITTGSWNESFETILKTKECCICVPTFDMVEYIGVRHQHVSGAVFLVDEINPGCYCNYNMYFIQTGLHAQGN